MTNMASPSVSKKPALSQEMDPEKIQEFQKVLQELKGVTLEECFNSAQRLIDRISSNPEDLQLGLDFLNLMKRALESNKGGGRSDPQSSDVDMQPPPCSEGAAASQGMNQGDTEVQRTRQEQGDNRRPGHHDKKRPAEEQGVKQQQKSSRHTGNMKVFLKVTGKTFGADEDLLDKVKRMSQSVTMETTRDLQDSHVVIVFCPITSRVASDVEAAMTDVRASCGQKPVILVLMHHTFDEDYSTVGTRWSEVYDNVKLDVHVLFHKTKRGLLTCPKNNEAAAQIVKEMEKHREAGCIIT